MHMRGDDVVGRPLALLRSARATHAVRPPRSPDPQVIYARRYLRRHHIDPAGLEVTTSYRIGAEPARVAAVELEIHMPAVLPWGRGAGLLVQAAHCTVHNSIMHTPDIAIALASTN